MTQYYVSTTGNNANNGLSTAGAWLTLTRAGSAGSIVTGGDIVNVQPGTYTGTVRTFKNGISKASRIHYRSDPAFADWSARISIAAASQVWINQGSFTIIEGFYMTGPSSPAGLITTQWTAGLGLGQKCDILRCKVENVSNTACNSSGGIHTADGASSCTVKQCVIFNIAGNLQSTCNTMQGIYLSGAGDTINSNLVGNIASVGIQQWHGASHSIYIGNTVFHCVHGYYIGQGDSGTTGGSKNNYVANNISAFNTRVGYYLSFGVGTGSNIYQNNCSFSNPEANFNLAPGDKNTGAILTDPKFKNYLTNGTGDYRISTTSACHNGGVDHGSASLGDVTFPNLDVAGNARPQGTTYDVGAYEFVEGAVDTTPPTLSLPTGTKTGTSTATATVTTNEANGTLYVYISTNSTETAATIVANGTSQAVSTTGVQTKNATGLSSSTTYFAHFVHDDSSLNRSNVVNSASFTTDAPADTTPPTLSSPTGTKTGVTTATCTVSTNEGNGTMYCWCSTNATETTGAIVANGVSQAVSSTGVKTFNITALAGATTYFAHFVHDDSSLNRSTASNSASFTTDTPADTTAPILTFPTGSSTGSTSGVIGVTSDDGTGTLYYYVSTNATETAATIVANGLTFAMTSSGTNGFAWSGLTALTTYYGHFVQDDAALNRSIAVNSASFTTDAAGAPTTNLPGVGGSARRNLFHQR